MSILLGMQNAIKSSKLSVTGVTTTVAAVSSYFVARKLYSHYRQLPLKKEQQRRERLIVISGCDSGLGHSMAIWAAKLGYKVLAGCLNENGEGAQKLLKDFPDQNIITRLDVTDKVSLNRFQALCKDILETDEGKLELWAVVANAAFCTMGEFFWQTETQKEDQMDVNFWGTVNLVSEFRTLLLEAKTKPRVIVISSDCSEYPLPFLSTYSASKAAVNSWTQSFRFEMIKYGIPVVAYQPRDFAKRSGLFSNLELQHNQMATEMRDKDKQFYGNYFTEFMKRKQQIFAASKKKSVQHVVDSSHHRNTFIHLLESDIRKIAVYRDFSLMEKAFHGLYMTLPQFALDKLVNLLLNPEKIQWKEPNNGKQQKL